MDPLPHPTHRLPYYQHPSSETDQFFRELFRPRLPCLNQIVLDVWGRGRDGEGESATLVEAREVDRLAIHARVNLLLIFSELLNLTTSGQLVANVPFSSDI